MSPDTALRVFIGYDVRQPLAFTVSAHSILRHATQRVQVEPLILRHMPIKRRGLTDFTYSRWLVPWLCDYQGDALFIDPDTVVVGDITEIRRMSDPANAVTVRQGPLAFEWASLMYFQNSNGACRTLTPEYVEDPEHKLFTFDWCPRERMGDLPPEWNHLVLYDAPNPQAKVIHYTAGIPCWEETKRCEAAAIWEGETKAALATVSFMDLMGNSVHRKAVDGLNRVA